MNRRPTIVASTIAMLFIVAAHLAISGCGGDDEETRQVIRERTNRKFPTITPKTPEGLRGTIAFASDGEIYMMKPDGSDRKNLTKHKATDNNPIWSPDGRKIAFLSNRTAGSNTFGLFVMKADGSKPHRVTNWAAQGELNFRPAWTPNGVIDPEGMLAWSDDFTQKAFIDADVIKILNVGEGTTTTITKVRSNRPTWSPDGKRIAYQAREGENDSDPWEIYVINADGTSNTNLSRDPEADDQYPMWSPDGRHNLYLYFRLVLQSQSSHRNIGGYPDRHTARLDWRVCRV
jgi:tricorn protease-like protein